MNPVQVSREHKEAGLVDHVEVTTLPTPPGYRRSIDDWFTRLGTSVQR